MQSNYRRNKGNLPVGHKPCPHCSGTGEVLCTGREYYQQLSHDWARSLHGKAVLIPFFVGRENGRDRWTQIPGLAIQSVARGGWGAVRVYISIDRYPNWGGFNLQLCGYDEDHDVINGHKLYYITKGRPSRTDVILLEDIPMEIREIKQIAERAGPKKPEGE